MKEEFMSIVIRQEEERDYRCVEHLTREAFWDVYRPGCLEHLVLHQIRKLPAFVKALSLVACDHGTIVGNIVYSKARVTNTSGQEVEVLCMGPFAVLPSLQKKGIGDLLARHSLAKAKELGFKAVVLFGNPHYYGRFGFVNAKTYGITTPSGENFDAFMALELFPGALNGVSGRFDGDPGFETKDADLKMFEKSFPPKEKHVLATQIFH
jgi:predicted N-acetyltransferase YhbS